MVPSSRGPTARSANPSVEVPDRRGAEPVAALRVLPRKPCFSRRLLRAAGSRRDVTAARVGPTSSSGAPTARSANPSPLKSRERVAGVAGRIRWSGAVGSPTQLASMAPRRRAGRACTSPARRGRGAGDTSTLPSPVQDLELDVALACSHRGRARGPSARPVDVGPLLSIPKFPPVDAAETHRSPAAAPGTGRRGE